MQLLATSDNQPTKQSKQAQTTAVCVDDFDDDDFGVEPTPVRRASGLFFEEKLPAGGDVATEQGIVEVVISMSIGR